MSGGVYGGGEYFGVYIHTIFEDPHFYASAVSWLGPVILMTITVSISITVTITY